VSGLGEAEVQVKSLLQMLSLSRKPAMQAASMLVCCQIRPLRSQQEEAMNSMKKLLLGTSISLFGASFRTQKRHSPQGDQRRRFSSRLLLNLYAPKDLKRILDVTDAEYYCAVATDAFKNISTERKSLLAN
jgi:hypothetical protein